MSIVLYQLINWAYAKRFTLLYIFIGIVLLFLIISTVRSCGDTKPRLNERQIQEAIVAIERKEEQRLREILAEADANEINANVAEARAERLRVIEESRTKYNNYTLDELAAEIERRANK